MSFCNNRGRKDITCTNCEYELTFNALCDECRDWSKTKPCTKCAGKGWEGGVLCGFCKMEGFI